MLLVYIHNWTFRITKREFCICSVEKRVKNKLKFLMTWASGLHIISKKEELVGTINANISSGPTSWFGSDGFPFSRFLLLIPRPNYDWASQCEAPSLRSGREPPLLGEGQWSSPRSRWRAATPRQGSPAIAEPRQHFPATVGGNGEGQKSLPFFFFSFLYFLSTFVFF